MSDVVRSLIREVEAKGGRISVDGPWLVINPRKAGEQIVDALRKHKAEIIELLRPSTRQGILAADAAKCTPSSLGTENTTSAPAFRERGGRDRAIHLLDASTVGCMPTRQDLAGWQLAATCLD